MPLFILCIGGQSRIYFASPVRTEFSIPLWDSLFDAATESADI
jgi:hypothetical protein